MSGFRAVLGVLLGDLRRRPGTVLATLAAMAAGVGVFVAIQLAGAAARSSFVSAVEAVAGQATHELVREGGVAEDRLPPLLALGAVEAAQPVVEGRVPVLRVLRDGKPVREKLPPLRLLGIDPLLALPFLREGRGEPVVKGEDFAGFLTVPHAAVLPRPWAERAGVRPGDELEAAAGARSVRVPVLAVYELEVLGEAARDTAVVDVASAQELFARLGVLTRIELIVKEGREREVEAALAPGERLQRPGERGERVAKMIDAFRLNLLALGGLALVVGALLVFNAAQFNVVRRMALLGRLRCLGATRAELLGAVLIETVLLGLAGGAAGLALGTLLAQRLVGGMGETITELYAFVQVDVANLDASTALLTLLGAMAVAAAAGFFPALDASRAEPRMAGLRSREELRFRAQLPRLLALVALEIAAGAAALSWPTSAWWPALLASFAFVGAGAALMPMLMAVGLPRMQALGERLGGLTLPLASGALLRSLTRTGGAAGALGVALSMTVGVIVMVGSFEGEVRRWIGAVLLADIYLSDPNEKVDPEQARLPAEIAEIARRTPGVRAVDTLRAVELPLGARTFLFLGGELSVPESYDRFEIVAGPPRQEAVARALAGEILISEPLATHHGLKAGDVLRVPGREGEAGFTVAAVVRDYSWDRGFAWTGGARFVEVFGDPGLRNVALYIEPGADLERTADALREAYAGRFFVQVRSNAQLRARILDVFERTFAVTYLLQAIATVMALAGIAVTLFGLFLERAREIATLRALGAPVARIGRLFAAESLLMAFFPVLLALPLGALLAWILIHVVNLRSFGWTIGFQWPWVPVLQTCALALAAGLLATAVPLLLAKRQSIAGALREE
ncbi:MAG: ABC transporter permease [Planctomycetota bacterium]|nr:ABC transporter permease [Planctomycetota bacterium]